MTLHDLALISATIVGAIVGGFLGIRKAIKNAERKYKL